MELPAIQSKIFDIRGYRVMLDFHLAELYQVETRALKQAVRRNIERFPEDFMFILTQKETNNLLLIGVSQNVIPPDYNFGVTKPMAFTEQGVAMLSSVLKSKVALEINISIMRAFVVARQYALGYAELKQMLEEFIVETESNFDEVYLALTQLAEKNKRNEYKPREPIGYVKEDPIPYNKPVSPAAKSK